MKLASFLFLGACCGWATGARAPRVGLVGSTFPTIRLPEDGLKRIVVPEKQMWLRISAEVARRRPETMVVALRIRHNAFSENQDLYYSVHYPPQWTMNWGYLTEDGLGCNRGVRNVTMPFDYNDARDAGRKPWDSFYVTNVLGTFKGGVIGTSVAHFCEVHCVDPSAIGECFGQVRSSVPVPVPPSKPLMEHYCQCWRETKTSMIQEPRRLPGEWLLDARLRDIKEEIAQGPHLRILGWESRSVFPARLLGSDPRGMAVEAYLPANFAGEPFEWELRTVDVAGGVEKVTTGVGSFETRRRPPRRRPPRPIRSRREAPAEEEPEEIVCAVPSWRYLLSGFVGMCAAVPFVTAIVFCRRRHLDRAISR